jgi:hypothetical protein
MSTKKYLSKRKRKNRGLRYILTTPLLLTLGGLALIAATLFVVWKSNQPSNPQVPIEVDGAPALKVDQEKIDFGDVPLNQTVTATFQLTNVGDETLRFSDKPYIEVVEGC